MGTIVIRQSASQIVDYTYNSRGREQQQQEQQQQVKGNIQQLQLQLCRALSCDRQPPCGYDFAHEKQTKPETETEPKTKTKPNSIGDLRHLVSLPLSLLLYKGIQVYIYIWFIWIHLRLSIYLSCIQDTPCVCVTLFALLLTRSIFSSCLVYTTYTLVYNSMA